MADGGNNFSPFGSEWKHFEELFKGITNLQQGKVQDLAWVDKFIKNVMKQSIPNTAAGPSQPQKLHTEVFETHKSVIVKVHIPNNIHPRNLQLYVNSQQLKIAGPDEGTVQFVRLPASVQSNSSRAEFRDGILQIQLRKKTKSERFDEVYIRFL